MEAIPVYRQWPRNPKYWLGDDGSVIGSFRRVLKPLKGGKSPYLAFSARGPAGEFLRHNIHVAVAETWLGPRPTGKEAAHKNGDCLDNRPSNLKWATSLENSADKRLHGTVARGERVATAILSEQDVLVVRSEYAEGLTNQSQLARRYGVTPSAIRSIVRGKAWAHVGGPRTSPTWTRNNEALAGKKTSK